MSCNHSVDGPFGRHPSYGLADETRMKILRDADAMGVKSASEKNRVSIQSIYSWRKWVQENK